MELPNQFPKQKILQELEERKTEDIFEELLREIANEIAEVAIETFKDIAKKSPTRIYLSILEWAYCAEIQKFDLLELLRMAKISLPNICQKY